MEIILIGTHTVRERFATFDQYKLDLGKKYTKPEKNGKLTLDVKDKYVHSFFQETGKICFKCGVLGPISIYTADISENEIYVYSEKKNEKIIIDLTYFLFNTELWLAETIQQFI
jgi:hypothetical protein